MHLRPADITYLDLACRERGIRHHKVRPAIVTMSRPDHDSFKLYPVRIRLTDTVLKTVSIPINPLNSFCKINTPMRQTRPKFR